MRKSRYSVVFLIEDKVYQIKDVTFALLLLSLHSYLYFTIFDRCMYKIFHDLLTLIAPLFSFLTRCLYYFDDFGNILVCMF